MLGKPMLIMHRCGNAPLTFFARPRLCSPLLWCTRCIPCSTEEGRALPLLEAQLLLTIAAESNALPNNTLVHLVWAWQIVTMPDGYIPATAQEALLHVFMGERAVSELLQQLAAVHSRGAPVLGPPAQRPAAVPQNDPGPCPSPGTAPIAATLAAPRPRRPLPALTCWRALTLPHTPTPTHCMARGCGRPWPAWTLSLSMTPCCSRAMCSAPHPLFANLNSAARSDLGCASSAMLLALTHLLPASAQKTPHVLGSFGFSSRMLLFRPAGTDRVPKPVILARFAAFFRGDWEPLLRAAIAGTSAPARPTTNTARHPLSTPWRTVRGSASPHFRTPGPADGGHAPTAHGSLTAAS